MGDDVEVGAQSGIIGGGEIEPRTRILGSPAMPADDTKRVLLAVQKLPALL